MRYDKSLKLINYAQVVNGNLCLFTELDHSFIIGDKIYIVGGYYDNCNSKLYSTGDPFADNSTGYTILSINYANNSFVIDYPIDVPTDPLIYPYGTTNNEFGDPFDNIDVAYNNYATIINKSVYVSTTTFTKGILKRGIVNNGIFGNDYHVAHLNNKGTTSGPVNNTDLVINHMVGKNVELSKGQINSKTDVSNFPTSRLKLNEDLSLGTAYNPFTVSLIAIGNNNDGFGYNCFERFINTATDVVINNGTFGNPNASYIAINNLNINKARLGSNTITAPLANQIDNVSISGGYVGSINTLNGIFNASNSTVNTYIRLQLRTGNPSPVTYEAAFKQITFNVGYDEIANNFLTTGQTVYISGIQGLVLGLTQFDLTHASGTIMAISYTFGVSSSANITIEFTSIPNVSTGGNWISWKAANPISAFNFSNLKIHLLQNKFECGLFYQSSLFSYFDTTVNFLPEDLYIDSCSIVESYCKGITYSTQNGFNGFDKGQSSYITQSRQIFQDALSASVGYHYTRIYDNLTPLKGVFNAAKIEKAIIHNSTLYDTRVVPLIGSDLNFIFNSTLAGMMYLDDSVHWDFCNTSGITLSYITGLTTYNQGAYLGNGRNTEWVTLTTTPVSGFALNVNKYEAKNHSLAASEIYHSQSIAKSTLSTPLNQALKFTKKYHVPSAQNIKTPLNTSVMISVIDRGSLSLSATNWVNNNNRLDVLFADKLTTTNGLVMDTAITKRYTPSPAGVNDTDFPFVAGASGYRDEKTVDIAYIYTDPNYFKTPHLREQSEITLNIHEQVPYVAPHNASYPDPGYVGALATLLKITGPGTYTVANTGVTPVTTITNGTYDTFLNIGNIQIDAVTQATTVPANFIEIERVFINTYSVGFGVLKSKVLYNSNYVPTNNYSGTPVNVNAYKNTDIRLYKNRFITQIIPFTKTVTTDIEVVVEYWVTWYYVDKSYTATVDGSKNAYRGGYRTKRTETFRFN